MHRFQSYLHDWSCLPHQLDAASLLLYLNYFPNHYTQFRLKRLQGRFHREHNSINNAWLSTELDMRRSAWGGWFFFIAATVREDPQCSKWIIVSGGYNINNANPRALHISWSSTPKGIKLLCIKKETVTRTYSSRCSMKVKFCYFDWPPQFP